jgi:hypothetical protein
MRKLFAYGLLAFGIYYMLKGGTGIITDLGSSNTAQVLEGLSQSELHELVLDHYKSTVVKTANFYSDAIKTTITDLNDDGKKDVVAIVESGMTCSSGGCTATIFMESDAGELKPIPIPYPVEHVEVLESLTNGMHDLRINHDEANRMIWDGTTYIPEQI